MSMRLGPVFRVVLSTGELQGLSPYKWSCFQSTTSYDGKMRGSRPGRAGGKNMPTNNGICSYDRRRYRIELIGSRQGTA